MEIYKRPQSILIIFLIFLVSCGYNKKESVKKEHETELLDANKQAKRQQELLKDWFDDFQSVQKEIFSINTNELLSLELKLESSNRQQTDRERIIEKIKKVKTLLKLKDDELFKLRKKIKEIGNGSTYFKNYIHNLENSIHNLENDVANKKYEIRELEYKYNSAIQKNDSLNLEISSSLKEIENLQSMNNQLKEELNKKFMIFIAKKEMKLIPLQSDNIPLINYKIKNIELLSYHPRNSYEITNRGKSTSIHIYNSDSFWNESNYLIIRIKKRRLN